jgi:hypothetical protein
MDYHLIVKFGDAVLPLNISNLRELTIVQDLNKFLPEFRMRILDTTGVLTHLIPFDKNMSVAYIELAESSTSEQKNSFTFSVFNRKPEGDQSNPSNMYDITGLLNINGMFSPDYCRSLPGNIKSNLESIAYSELDADSTEVSSSLDYTKSLIQPKWSNVQFLKHLKENAVGKNQEYGFKCFVKCQNMKQIFVFKSLYELVKQSVSYKFLVKPTQYKDMLPVFNYSIFDYYKIHEVFASKKQSYSYFDYDTSTFIQAEENAQNFESLSDYYLIDRNDSEGSNALTDTGRSNDFTKDFKGMVRSSFSNRLMDLVKMWITTRGLQNIVPGQTIQLIFPHGMESGNLYSYQYSGYWLVEKVVHNIGDTFLTKLLLTRNGLDTDKATTLLKSTKKKVTQ